MLILSSVKVSESSSVSSSVIFENGPAIQCPKAKGKINATIFSKEDAYFIISVPSSIFYWAVPFVDVVVLDLLDSDGSSGRNMIGARKRNEKRKLLRTEKSEVRQSPENMPFFLVS